MNIWTISNLFAILSSITKKILVHIPWYACEIVSLGICQEGKLLVDGICKCLTENTKLLCKLVIAIFILNTYV